MMKVLRALLLSLAFIAPAAAQVMQLTQGQVIGNPNASQQRGQGTLLSPLFDQSTNFGSTRGALLERGASVWGPIAPSATAGLAFVSNGTGADPGYGIVALAGGGCNAALAASNGGLLYSTASACAVLPGTATAGQIPLSGSNAAPAWSTATYPATTAAGTLLGSAGANVIAATPTPTLGVAGSVVGSLGFANITSGSVKLQPATGALGSSILTLPAITDTLAGKALANGGTNNSLTAVSGGVVWSDASKLNISSAGAANSFMTWGGAGAAPNAVALTGLVFGNGASAPTALSIGTGLGASAGNLNLQPAAPSTIGGVQSYTSPANQFLTGISTAGVPQSAQPSFGNLGGTCTLAQGCLGGSQSAATANQIPVYPGGGAAAVPTTIGGVGGIFDTICSSTIGQAWVRFSNGWGCAYLGWMNPVWWGADPTGVVDSTSAINSAISAAASSGLNNVFIPGGTYKYATSISVSITNNYVQLHGVGPGATQLIANSAAVPGIVVGNGLTGVRIYDLMLNRSVSATSGGDGIQWALTGVSDGEIYNLRVWNNYNNLYLGPTALSYLHDVRAEYAQGDNIRVVNNAAQAGAQWHVKSVYAGQATGWGYVIQTNSGAPAGGMGTGIIDSLETFANCSGGFGAFGSLASPVQAVRLVNSFFGQDNASEVYFDTYSADNSITSTFIELAGTAACGPTLGTPASHAGDGIFVSANTASVQIDNIISNGNSTHGLETYASWTSVNDYWGTYNGNLGMFVSNGANAVLTHGYFVGNFGALSISSNSSSMQVADTTPSALNNIILNSVVLGAGQYPGTPNNNNATAGNFGEYVVSSIASGSAVSLTTSTPANVTSISLTAGDWDVWFDADFGGSGTTTVTGMSASISTTSATINSTVGSFAGQSYNGANVFGNIPVVSAATLKVGPVRQSLSATTTIYAVVDEIFGTSTANAYGVLRARRVR